MLACGAQVADRPVEMEQTAHLGVADHFAGAADVAAAPGVAVCEAAASRDGAVGRRLKSSANGSSFGGVSGIRRAPEGLT